MSGYLPGRISLEPSSICSVEVENLVDLAIFLSFDENVQVEVVRSSLAPP